MKIKYYGTAAAEGFPGIFCDCEPCRKARTAGGRNIRTRSQALIDDKILIDFPPDIYLHVLNYGLDLKPVTTCIITHGHSDHLYPKDFEMRRHGFTYTADGGALPSLNVYASGATADMIAATDDCSFIKDGTINLNKIKAFETFSAEGYEITPLEAMHAPSFDPVIYIVAKGGKALLYANDTGYFTDDTWQYLEKEKPHFDYVSLDCTGMTMQNYRNGHMCLEVNAEVRDRLIEIGCADEKTIFCSHHFSHNGGLTHDEFSIVAAKQGFLASYDTMEVEF